MSATALNNRRRDYFRRFLASGGYCIPPGRAACALAKARIFEQWRDAEEAGLVRLRAEPEDESYFSVYGEPGGYRDARGHWVSAEEERKAIVEQIERDGCWCVLSEVWTGERWEVADSIGMCIYSNPCDPFQNDYVPDLMSSALMRIQQSGEH